jgi:hypothetical protein
MDIFINQIFSNFQFELIFQSNSHYSDSRRLDSYGCDLYLAEQRR